ncbi:hypothetical protein l11_02130 [Neisseria weaveri LMG 5135]|nr:hypothetical protein l11_02130 [Neisseria weaveri LMG 5135]
MLIKFYTKLLEYYLLIKISLLIFIQALDGLLFNSLVTLQPTFGVKSVF